MLWSLCGWYQTTPGLIFTTVNATTSDFSGARKGDENFGGMDAGELKIQNDCGSITTFGGAACRILMGYNLATTPIAKSAGTLAHEYKSYYAIFRYGQKILEVSLEVN